MAACWQPAMSTVRFACASGRWSTGFDIGHAGWIWAVTFSPDGNTLASCSSLIRLWDVQTIDFETVQSTANLAEAVIQPFQSPVSTPAGSFQSVWTIAFSPDGQLLASGGDDQTILECPRRNLPNGFAGSYGGVMSVSFSPNGQILVASQDSSIRLWVLIRHHPQNPGHSRWVRQLSAPMVKSSPAVVRITRL